MVPGTRPEIPEPHAHGYYRYEDAGQWKMVDVTRQNPSWLAGAGDMISTTKDLHTFISALKGGKLLPAPLLAEMRKPHPHRLGYGLGLFVQDRDRTAAAPSSTTTAARPAGYAALMYSTPDGKTTLTAVADHRGRRTSMC